MSAPLFVLLAGVMAGAQSLSVQPVNVLLAPGQRAATMAVTNQGNKETAIQIRGFAWNQPDGDDQLTASDTIVVSPPITSIAPGATQVLRLILREPPHGHEATYRILLDQIPPTPEPGIVHVVLRLSIPIFAEPDTRAVPRVQFHIEREAGELYLVGINDGLRHEAVRDILLTTKDGGTLKAEAGISPYILAGSTRRWHIAGSDMPLLSNETLRLTAHMDAGTIEQRVGFVAAP